jgi:hypothetical protein
LTPLPPEVDGVVPTQYQWRLRNGLLTGSLDVSNPTSETSDATAIPELFPSSALRGSGLALADYDGPVERQPDGSVLVRFEVPPLAPRAHHVVGFRLAVPDDGVATKLLSQLVRDRDAAIDRLALTLSQAPTLANLSLALASSLNVGQRADASLSGTTVRGEEAPVDLLKAARLEVLGGDGVVRVEGLTVVGVSAGAVVVRAVVGDLHVDSPISVVAAPAAKARTTTTRPRKPATTVTTIWEEEAPPPAPRTVVL